MKTQTRTQQRRPFRVDGLDCAEEVLLLKQALENRPGIVGLDFDVVNARMYVAHEPERISVEEICEAVSRTGLKAVPWERAPEPEAASWWSRHGRNLLTALCAVLLVTGFVVHAFFAQSIVQALGYGEAPAGGVPVAVRIIYLFSILSGIWFIAPKAWAALRRLRPDMNLLMSLAVIGAIILDQWLEAATVTFLFALALLLEHWSMGRTRRAIASLLDLSPPTARVIEIPSSPAAGSSRAAEREMPVEEVAVGSTVTVRPHEKIPLDGIVLKGTSSVNEAPITGESVPVSKSPDDEVFAGTVNEEGTLEFRVTKPAADTTLARIVHLVQEAHARRAPSEQWVETFARYYTPAMMFLAFSIAVVPPLFTAALWTDWIYRGLVVLVIACPCALVISTPVSIVSGLTAAVRHGVLVKGGRYLEALARIKVVALDKTGTVTRGRPAVQSVLGFNGHDDKEVLERAAAMEAQSQHPFARAILRRADEAGIAPQRPENYKVLSGRGAEGDWGGRRFWIGSHRLMHESGGETPEIHDQALKLEDAGHSVVAVGNENHVCGLIGIADEIRPGIAETVAALGEIGIRPVVMLTGDNDQTARAVADVVGIETYLAGLLPEDKVREVERLRAEHKSVAMVGDGVNDAPALAASTVGIAMASMGTDTAIETADVALMSDDIAGLPWLITHARRTLRTVQQNITLALGIKVVFLLLTFLGAASLWAAIAADMGASLLVIFNGLRLLKA